jgi:hypothetical protein
MSSFSAPGASPFHDMYKWNRRNRSSSSHWPYSLPVYMGKAKLIGSCSEKPSGVATCMYEVAVEAHNVALVQSESDFRAVILFITKSSAFRHGKDNAHDTPFPGSVHMPMLPHQRRLGETIHKLGGRHDKMRECPHCTRTVRVMTKEHSHKHITTHEPSRTCFTSTCSTALLSSVSSFFEKRLSETDILQDLVATSESIGY